MSYYDQRTTGVWIMSGLDYSVHENSFVWVLKHNGLNRVRYRLINADEYFKLDVDEDESKYWVEVKRCRANVKYGFKRNRR